MADGATDVSCLEEEIVYMRFVSGGAPKTCYVVLAKVKNAKAPSILEAIKSVMDTIDPTTIWLNTYSTKMIALLKSFKTL